MVHVPYRGAAPDHAGPGCGRVQVMFNSVTLQMPQLTAVATRPSLRPQRVDVLPAVPRDPPAPPRAGRTPEEFTAHVATERPKWGDVIRKTNIRIE